MLAPHTRRVRSDAFPQYHSMGGGVSGGMTAEDLSSNSAVGLTERKRRVWISVRAGLLRIVLSGLGVVAALQIPGLTRHAWVFVAYFCFSIAAQLLIRRRIRLIRLALAIGIVDLLFVTFLVQLLGSTHSVLSFLYLLIPIVFATPTARRRISMTLAVVGALAYLSVLGLEWLRVIPYASALPGQPRPAAVMLFFNGLFVTIAMVTTTRFVSQLIAALREVNARLQEQSQRDELTGLYNRRYLHIRLEAELARVQRGGKLMLLTVDLDGFKRVNDEEGHEAGDRVLQAVAQALLKATRRSDVVARYGGDEFVVLLPDTGPDGCQAVAARIVDHARDVGRETFPAIPVTASVGVAMAQPTDDAAGLTRRSDEGVYEAKRGGGDRAVSV